MIKHYVGARYVPKFASPIEWAADTSYEALTIVTFNNASYTSKVPVPPTVGNPAKNPQYWALTGNYNAQVEQYRQETETVSNNLTTEITKVEQYRQETETVSNNLTTEITNRKNADTTLQGQITTEITNRETADATLQKNIGVEATARQAADNTLQGNINSEASTRASADSNLQSQINQIVAPSGEAPSAAEVQNARIGADGVTYDTLGTAIRTQVNDINEAIGDLDRIFYEQYIDIGNSSKDYYWSNADTKASSEGFYAFEPFTIPAGTYYYSDLAFSFCFFKAVSSGNVTKPLVDKHVLTKIDITEPSVVYLTTSTSYDVNKATFANFYGLVEHKKGISGLSVSNILDLNEKNLSEQYLDHNLTLSNCYWQDVDSWAKEDGFYAFYPIEIKAGTYYYRDFNKALSFFKDSDGKQSKPFANEEGYVTFKTNGIIYITANDWNYMKSIFCDAKVPKSMGQLKGKILNLIPRYSLVNDVKGDNVKNSKYYSDNLASFLDNLSNGINNVESLKSPNGSKFGLIVNDDGTLSTYRYIPNKYAVMGNSITCGMDNKNEHGGMFGMAASSFYKDWVHYVNDAIVNKNNGATYNRIYASPFEHCENIDDATAWITANVNQLSSDNDLVIIEIGDNVNTDLKKETFKLSFPKLLNSIRDKCPKARIACVGIWFNNDDVKDVITMNCSKYGCSFIDITDLNTKENQAVVGSEVTFKDGSKGTITSEIATHPGDKGMKLIGERVVEKLEL